jgi:hypothetical protein
MRALKLSKQTFISFCLLVTVLPLAAHAVSAQITIGGISVSKPKRANKPKPEQPATKEAIAQPSESKSAGTESAAPATRPESPEPQDDIRISVFLDDIKKAKSEIERYNPADWLYLVSEGDASAALLRAVSPRERQKFLSEWSKANGINKLVAPFDDLAAAAAKKLPTYIPKPNGFAFHNPLPEKMMKGALDNVSTLKINKIGLSENAWLIDKNDIGIPMSRYKHGSIWARDTSDDHPYYHFYRVNIIEDYAGGGTYGASYAKLVQDELVGCP